MSWAHFAFALECSVCLVELGVLVVNIVDGDNQDIVLHTLCSRISKMMINGVLCALIPYGKRVAVLRGSATVHINR
jgi:hypothetical protein